MRSEQTGWSNLKGTHIKHSVWRRVHVGHKIDDTRVLALRDVDLLQVKNRI